MLFSILKYKNYLYSIIFNVICWSSFFYLYLLFVSSFIFNTYIDKTLFTLKLDWMKQVIFYYFQIIFPKKLNLWHLDWSIAFPNPVSLGLESIHIFHNDIWLILGTIFCLVVYVGMEAIIRFNVKHKIKNAKNAKLIEFIWTVLPILLVILILIPSLSLSFILNTSPTSLEIEELPTLSITVTGNQWFWQYEMDIQDMISYLDIHPELLKKYSKLLFEPIKFDAYMVPTADLTIGELRGLTTTQKLVLPLGVEVKLNGNSKDVLHSWTVNGFDVKMDVVPGRINQQSFQVLVPGKFYGQCSELCGLDHGFMPITIEVITMPDFANWLSKILEQRLSSNQIMGITRFLENKYTL